MPAFAHPSECACPAFARLRGGANHQFVVMHLHLHLVLEPALLNHWLRKANSATVSYSDNGCLHDYNVITSRLRVNPVSGAPNVCMTRK